MGITYGVTRHNYLQNKEDKTKEVRYRLKAEREAKLLLEKQKFAEGYYLLIIYLNNVITRF